MRTSSERDIPALDVRRTVALLACMLASVLSLPVRASETSEEAAWKISSLGVPAWAGPALPSQTLKAQPPPRVLPTPVLALAPRPPQRRLRPWYNPQFKDWSTLELKKKRAEFNFAGPITLFVLSAPIATIGGVYAIGTTVVVGGNFYLNQECRCDDLLIATALSWAAFGAGAGMAVWGGITLGAGAKQVGALNREIALREGTPVDGGRHRHRPVREPRASLTLGHGPTAVPLGFGWGVQGAF